MYIKYPGIFLENVEMGCSKEWKTSKRMENQRKCLGREMLSNTCLIGIISSLLLFIYITIAIIGMVT